MKHDDMAEALEWTRGTWTLDEVRAELESRLDVPLARTSLRNMLVDLGAGPIHKAVSRDSKRGRVGYYDPLLCFVVWVAHTSTLDTATLASRLEDARDVARKAVWGRLANTPRKRNPYSQAAWDWRVESAAYHLFISDVRHGPDPRALHRLLADRPQLMYLTLDSNVCLETVLRAYAARYVMECLGLTVDPTDVNLFAGSRDPLFDGRIATTDTLQILESFGVLHPGGSRLSEPSHYYFDQPDTFDHEGSGA